IIKGRISIRKKKKKKKRDAELLEFPSNHPTSEQDIIFFMRLKVLKHFIGTEARGDHSEHQP
ncbi:unnamed protein product, partial [Bubo scandiacus]